jgi:hypothetical protein
METRELTIHEKLKVVMEMQEYLCLSREEYRQLLLYVMKTYRARQKAQQEYEEGNPALLYVMKAYRARQRAQQDDEERNAA